MKQFWSVSAALVLFVNLVALSVARDDKKDASKDKADKAKVSEQSNSPKETPYYPLQIGNTWSYRIGDNRYSLKVAKYEKVGDLNCARLEMVVNGKVVATEDIGVT